MLSFTRTATHGKAHTSVAGQTLGRNIGDRRRAVGLTQEQLAEYLEIDTLTVSRYETGNILPPLTVVDVVARLLNTTIADLLGEAPVQPVEHADRIGIWLASLALSDRDWIERVVKQLVERCQPRKRGRPRTRPKADKVPPPSPPA